MRVGSVTCASSHAQSPRGPRTRAAGTHTRPAPPSSPLAGGPGVAMFAETLGAATS